MRNLFKIVSISLLLSCFCFNSLLGISLNNNVRFSFSNQGSKFKSNDIPSPSGQVVSINDLDNEMILENELEDDNEESFSESHWPENAVAFRTHCTKWHYLSLHATQKPKSLNILYCVLNI